MRLLWELSGVEVGEESVGHGYRWQFYLTFPLFCWYEPRLVHIIAVGICNNFSFVPGWIYDIFFLHWIVLSLLQRLRHLLVVYNLDPCVDNSVFRLGFLFLRLFSKVFTRWGWVWYNRLWFSVRLILQWPLWVVMWVEWCFCLLWSSLHVSS